MENEQSLKRKVEALRGVYQTKGLELNDEEATALARHLGNKPLWAAVLCAVIVVALLAFLIIRYL